MVESKKLGDIALINLGKAFKTAIENAGDQGNSYLIQISDINSGKVDLAESLTRIEIIPNQDSRYFLNIGDILLPLRGATYSPYIVRKQLAMPMVTTNQVAAIRVDSSRVSPFYLQWYLSSQQAKKNFGLAEGTNIAKLSASFLADMHVPLPSLDIQVSIARVYQNWIKQRGLHQKLIVSGDQYFNRLCDDLLSSDI